MQYSQVGIANVALGRIGARGQIVDINENSPNAIKVLAVWDTVFQEVLSERDWKFAKIRAQLQLSTNAPLYGFRYAWALPSDFLRLVRQQKRPHDRLPYPFTWTVNAQGGIIDYQYDDPFWPREYAYKVETLIADGNKYLLTNYDGTLGPAMITYIRLITDYTQLMPGFVNCLANRLAMELAIGITEDKQKREEFKQDYRDSLNSAQAQNECMDLVSFDESGSTSWVDAGRCAGYL